MGDMFDDEAGYLRRQEQDRQAAQRNEQLAELLQNRDKREAAIAHAESIPPADLASGRCHIMLEMRRKWNTSGDDPERVDREWVHATIEPEFKRGQVFGLGASRHLVHIAGGTGPQRMVLSRHGNHGRRFFLVPGGCANVGGGSAYASSSAGGGRQRTRRRRRRPRRTRARRPRRRRRRTRSRSRRTRSRRRRR